MDEDFDADEILRDIDDHYRAPEEPAEEDVRELQFGTQFEENRNFRDMADELDGTGDLWE